MHSHSGDGDDLHPDNLKHDDHVSISDHDAGLKREDDGEDTDKEKMANLASHGGANESTEARLIALELASQINVKTMAEVTEALTNMIEHLADSTLDAVKKSNDETNEVIAALNEAKDSIKELEKSAKIAAAKIEALEERDRPALSLAPARPPRGSTRKRGAEVEADEEDYKSRRLEPGSTP